MSLGGRSNLSNLCEVWKISATSRPSFMPQARSSLHKSFCQRFSHTATPMPQVRKKKVPTIQVIFCDIGGVRQRRQPGTRSGGATTRGTGISSGTGVSEGTCSSDTGAWAASATWVGRASSASRTSCQKRLNNCSSCKNTIRSTRSRNSWKRNDQQLRVFCCYKCCSGGAMPIRRQIAKCPPKGIRMKPAQQQQSAYLLFYRILNLFNA